jgi:FkbH-like protein
LSTHAERAVREVLAEVDERPTLARLVAATRRLDDLHRSHDGLFQPRTVAIVRNFTVEPIEPHLRLAGFRAGIALDVGLSGYDPTGEEVSGLVGLRTDFVMIFVRPEEMAPALAGDFTATEPHQAAELAQGVVARVVSLVRAGRAAGPAPILVHNFASPPWPAAGLLDAQRTVGQMNLIRRMNVDLTAEIAGIEGAFVVDLDQVIARLGLDRCYDRRSGRMSDAPYSQEAWRAIADADLRHLRAVAGARVKCLVVDCDNTLWGGVVGEDGTGGIALGDTGPGRVHRDFQQRLLDLKRRGILLAITSKNEEEDVMEVLRHHPDCLLQVEDFAAIRVNWDGKASNIKSIARELHLALEHLAFIDDDEFECGDVAAQLPDVQVLRWPVDVDGTQDLDGPALFDTLAVTDEDRARTEMYRADSERRRVQESVSSPEEYLHSLRLRAAVGRAYPPQLGRLAQLTQRTNQFNLTSRRYEVAQLERMSTDPLVAMLWLQLEDRFGSHGLVGCGILRRVGTEAVIDDFLLSCRVLGRRAEGVLLNRLSRAARAMGATVLVGEYRPTARNRQVADLYSRMGFVGRKEIDGGVRWSWPLAGGDPGTPEWIEVVDIEEDAMKGVSA